MLMRLARQLTLTIVPLAVFLLAGCGDSGNDNGNGDSVSTAASETPVNADIDVTDACAFLSSADFAAVGFTVEGNGEDVSGNFNLSTTSSVACQWMTFDDNIGSSWELVIGSGDAEATYDFDSSFVGQDTVTPVDLGDEAYLADKVSSFDSADHDFEVGVRIGDIFFKLSTLDDRSVEAIVALATLVANQLAA